MKKIVFFSHSQALGGAELSMLEIMAWIDRNEFLPVLLAPGSGPLNDRAKKLGVETIKFEIAPSLLRWHRGATVRLGTLIDFGHSVLKLGALIRALKPVVLYTHSQKAHVLGGLTGRLAGVPVVWHLREIFQHGSLATAASALSRCVPTRVLCVSGAVARHFSGIGAEVRVVPNGIDADEVRRLAGQRKARQKGPGPAPLVGTVSRIAPGKGQHVFISAAALISKSYPRAKFLVVGGPLFGEEDYLRELRQRAESLGLHGRIAFTGHLENPLPAMAELDVLVHCPVAPEGFGRVVAEAMALGVPVVSVRSGGIPELVDDGVNGLLAEPGDVNHLAKDVIQLLSHPTLGRRLAREAARKIQNHYRIETVVSKIEKSLLEV